MAKETGTPEFIGSLVVEHTGTRMLEVVEFPDFSSDARALLTDEQLETMRHELSTLRQLGSIIKDTNGLRKFRWGAKGKGKRGGVRVIYYYGGDHMPIFLIAVYSKSEKADMSPAEKKAARKIVSVIKEEYRAKMSPPQLRVVHGRAKGKWR
jgi:mRNA-degrading endonuclease RelE of RelBE toxin-antitoxin system